MAKGRRSTEAGKATRSRSWARGQQRKELRRQRARELHEAKQVRYAAGEQTPRDLMWDELKERMRARRVQRREVRRESDYRRLVREPRQTVSR